MDAMPLLRTYRDDLPEPDDARMTAIRARVDDRILATAPRRPGRPVGRRFALGAAAVAVAAGVVVAVVTPSPGASAEASRLLEGAAAGVGGSGPRTVVVRTEGLSLRIGADGGVAAAYDAVTVTTLEIPTDGGEWTRSSYPLPATTFYGGSAGRALAEEEGALADLPYSAEAPLVERSPDGGFTNGQLGGGTVFGDSAAALQDLPTDPTRMLAVLRTADLGAGEAAAQPAQVLAAAAAVLRSGSATPAVQSAVFRALRLQPGIAAVAHVADLQGRDGVAIGERHPGGPFDAQQLLLSPTTGRYLGERSLTVRPQGVLPAGTVVSASAVSAG